MTTKFYKHNLLNTKVYTPGNKSILDIDLDKVGIEYIRLMMETKKDRDLERKALRERLEFEYITKYNEINEGSYEGDFEHLEAEIDARMGNHCNLGSEQKEKFKKYLEDWAKSNGVFGTAHVWLFPQMLKYLANKVPVRRYDTNEISARTMLDSIGSDKILIGILAIFMSSDRKIFLKSQTNKEEAPYAKLTPLFMYAYKIYHNIPYSEWFREEVELVVEKTLADAMVTELPDLSKEDLNFYKKDALLVKSGEKAGQVRSSISTYILYPKGDSPLYPLNSLSRAMLCQTWLAHPDNRQSMMVLDPDDWDNMPEALVASKVLKSREETTDIPTGIFW